MRLVGAAEIDGVLDFPSLINALGEAFRSEIAVPVRDHHAMRRAGAEAALILMPAWHAANGYIGVKVVSVFPDNAARHKPSVMGTYLLMAGDNGDPLAAFDGQALTLWRTA